MFSHEGFATMIGDAMRGVMQLLIFLMVFSVVASIALVAAILKIFGVW